MLTCLCYLLHIVDESTYKFCTWWFHEDQAFIYCFLLLSLSEFVAAAPIIAFARNVFRVSICLAAALSFGIDGLIN